MQKTKETVRLIQSYGPLQRGMEYKVVDTGRDYIVVKRGGSLIHVPQDLIAPAQYRFEERYEEVEEDYEEGLI